MSSTRKPRYGDIFAGHDEGETLSEWANVLWELYKSDLVERGLWNGVRAQTLDRLVRARVEYDYLHPIVIAEGPVKRGEKGDYVNLKWSMAQKLNDTVSKLERSLTLTPESAGEKIPTQKPKKMTGAAQEFLESSRPDH